MGATPKSTVASPVAGIGKYRSRRTLHCSANWVASATSLTGGWKAPVETAEGISCPFYPEAGTRSPGMTSGASNPRQVPGSSKLRAAKR